MTITTPAQMREAAARCCEAEADKCDDAAKWGGSKRYVSDCKAAAYAMLDRAAAIRGLPVAKAAPVAVKVKPLEFEGRNGFWRAADGLGGFYEICEVNGGFHMTRITLGVGSAFVTYPTIDAAQAAANADHAARILPQIEAIPAAQVRAEALREVLADDEMCLRLAEGYDREDAAQRGEPSPHTMGDEGYAEWAADRIACAKAGLRALIGG